MSRGQRGLARRERMICMANTLRKGERAKPGRSSGFTLMELLVAITILSVVFVALYGTFFSILGSRSVIDRELEASREMSRFADQFSREARSALFKTNNPRTAFIGQRRSVDARPLVRLTFTTAGYPLPGKENPAGDVICVRYFAEETTSGKTTLYKEAWNPYAEDAKKAPVKAAIVEEIEGFDVSYFNGKDWAGTWDSSLDKRIPDAVKAVISVKYRGAAKEFTVIARTMIR